MRKRVRKPATKCSWIQTIHLKIFTNRRQLCSTTPGRAESMNRRFYITAMVLVNLVSHWGNTAAAQDFETVSGRQHKCFIRRDLRRRKVRRFPQLWGCILILESRSGRRINTARREIFIHREVCIRTVAGKGYVRFHIPAAGVLPH